ncbi:MAG: co-chaperone GroES [Alphaproteobacteria bacterium]|nr:co-chaperone GroES [Alphaproteobacteria bacterium]MCB9759616.1 co-chaperone GroES [Alphaproteobacteria bacterium]
MAFRPLNDRILLKRVAAKAKSAGGLFIPESAKDKPQEAEVVAVGPGKRLADGSRRAPAVQVGDRVLFGKYSGDEFKLDGEEHVVLRDEDILAVLDA